MASGTFDLTSEVSTALLLRPGESVAYTLPANSYVGTVVLERRVGTGAWQEIARHTADASATIVNEGLKAAEYRLRALGFTPRQTIAFSAEADAGDLKLSYDGGDPIEIAHDAATPAATLQTALRLITGLGAVTVTGSFAAEFVVTFVGLLEAEVLVDETSTLEASSAPVTITIAEVEIAWTLTTTSGDDVTEILYRDRSGRPVLGLRDDGSLKALRGGLEASGALTGTSQTGTQDLSALTVTGVPLTTDGVGAKAGATVSVVERGNGLVHKTVLTLAATPITLTDEADTGQAGGVKLYDFPAGCILVLGAVIDADIVIAPADFTDAAEGDVSLGTAAAANGGTLTGTEANILASTAIAAMTAQAGPINAQSLLAGVPIGGAGATDLDLYLNVRIDDAVAHVTGSGLITGTVTLTWINLGDF